MSRIFSREVNIMVILVAFKNFTQLQETHPCFLLSFTFHLTSWSSISLFHWDLENYQHFFFFSLSLCCLHFSHSLFTGSVSTACNLLKSFESYETLLQTHNPLKIPPYSTPPFSRHPLYKVCFYFLPLFALQHPQFMLPPLIARSQWSWPVSGIDTADTLSYLKLPALLVPGTCFSLGISPTFLTIPCQPFTRIRKGWWSIGLSLDCLLSLHCSFSHCSPGVQSHRLSSQLPIHVAISCYSLNISTGVSRLPRFIFSEVRLLLFLLHIYFSPGHSYLGIDISTEAVTRDNTCTRCVPHVAVTK